MEMRVHGEASNYLILTFKTQQQKLYQYLWLVVEYCINLFFFFFFGLNVCLVK